MSLKEKFIGKNGFNPNGLHKMKLPLPPPPPPKEVYTFQSEDLEENILYGNNNVVRAGTLEKLVERLTSEKVSDPQFGQAFLLTYRTFTTPNHLLNILKARYYMESLSGSEISEWETKLKAIRLKVVNVLKQWIQKGFYDFVDNSKLRKNFFQFLEEMTELPGASKNLQSIFERQEQEARNNKNITFGDRKPPTPILPKVIPILPTILDIHPEEIARQLTIIESSLYRAIKPWECLNQSWSKKDKDKRAPRVIAMINRFNLVSNWFAAEVMKPEALKQRIAVLKHIIDIGDKCLNLNNFNAVMEVVSGLQNSAVFRLKQTWAGLDKTRYVRLFEEQREVMLRDQNYKNFREKLHNVNPPCIPYLGVYLTDLTFIEDGNPALTGNLINFVKRQKVSEVISEIQQYQDVPYCLERVDSIHHWLNSIEMISEDNLYKTSEQRECRSLQNKNGQLRKRTSTLTKQILPLSKPEKKRESNFANNSNNSNNNNVSLFASPYGELEEIKGYRFYEKDNDSNIVFEEVKDEDRIIIKAATLPKLVERLTYERYPDTHFLFAFLMTYKTFTTANELLDLLIMRFNMPHPKAPSKEQARLFKSEKLVPIHFRVFNVLKNWVEKYMIDFKQDTVLVQRVLDFVEKATESQVALEKVGVQIKTHLNLKKFDNTKKDFSANFGLNIGEVFEKAKLSSNNNNNNNINNNNNSIKITTLSILLETYDINIIAEQIHYTSQRVFFHLAGRECLQKFWCSPEAKVKSPNLFYLHKKFDSLSRWVATEIVLSPDIKSRAQITENFISLAEKLVKLKDLQDAFALLYSISKLKEKELKQTWEWIHPKFIHLFNRLIYVNPKGDITTITDHKKAKVPQIPYIEDEIEKLELIHDSNPDYIGANNDLIFFEKRQLTYTVYANMCVDRNEAADSDKSDNSELQSLLSSLRILSREEITTAGEQMNNERPEGVPPTQKSNEHEKQVSEENIQTFLTKQLIYLIEDDSLIQKNLFNILINETKDQFIDQIKEEIGTYRDYSRLFFQIQLAQSTGDYCTDVIRSTTLKIIERKFINSKVEVCTINADQFSSSSFVYCSVEDESNVQRFIAVVEFVDVDLVMRVKEAMEYYVAENGLHDSLIYPGIVGMECDVDVYSFACDIEVQIYII